MFEHEIRINQFLIQYGRMLVSDIPDERLTEQPSPGVNHPAWILGHLALTGDSVARLLGGEKVLAESWGALFGPGSQPGSSRGNYPTKEELLRALEERYERCRQLASEATADALSRPNPMPGLREGLPTVGDLAAFLLTGHLGLHLGQLSMWRRMSGFAPLF